ncbi:MAG: hypothetical protein IJ710_06000 [Prevotella sp.]|nr:hypothetical protein [Prevotella sp.]
MRTTSFLRHSALALAVLLGLLGCTDGEAQLAEAMLNRAQAAYEAGDYLRAISTIDSLRTHYPKQLDVRRRALTLYQEASLRHAQDELARTDSLLEAAKQDYSQLQALLQTGRMSDSDWQQMQPKLTQARRRRDSLQVQFDTQCAQIKYIHRKQKDN